MTRMSLQEWDRRIAPFLITITIRARQVQNDAKQIREWVERLPAAPDFETTAFSTLRKASDDLTMAVIEIKKAIHSYEQKEKVS